jgi:integrase
VWQRQLRGQDLRHLHRHQLVAIVEGAASAKQISKRNKLVVALLDACRYLEEQGHLDPAQSPARWLHVARADPARLHRRRHHDAATLASVYSCIHTLLASSLGGPRPLADQAQAVRDVMLLQCRYGLHQLEVCRLAGGGGDTKVQDVTGLAPVAGSVSFFHQKARRWHHISVDAAALAAVRRLQQRGCAPNASTMRRYLAAAASRAGVERVLPSRLRHSMVVLSRTGGRLVKPNNSGLDLAAVAAICGHRSGTA